MTPKTKRASLILTSVTAAALIMSAVDGVISPPYIVKSAVKLVLFLAVASLYYAIDREAREEILASFKPKGAKNILFSGLLGLLAYGVIVGGYFLTRDFIDFSNITASLTGGIGVNADNFIYVAIYISIVNSMLEELLFRGLAFTSLKRSGGRALAYVFSSLIFAVYHIGMTLGWVEIYVFLAGLLGLAAGGAIFDYINERSECILSSWIVHMCINLGINTVGCILFGII